MKKLELNEDKCHKMHLGAKRKTCPDTHVHGELIKEVDKDKYLGDVISKDGKLDKNINSRVGKLIGVSAQIMNILKELSLGKFHFDIALSLRQSIFLPVLLLNSETWFNITKKNIEDLEMMDHNLLRKIMDAPSKTPIAALYLELGCLPIRYLIMYKRVMYLFHILQLQETHLVSQVFSSQMKSPSKGEGRTFLNR